MTMTSFRLRPNDLNYIVLHPAVKSDCVLPCYDPSATITMCTAHGQLQLHAPGLSLNQHRRNTSNYKTGDDYGKDDDRKEGLDLDVFVEGLCGTLECTAIRNELELSGVVQAHGPVDGGLFSTWWTRWDGGPDEESPIAHTSDKHALVKVKLMSKEEVKWKFCFSTLKRR